MKEKGSSTLLKKLLASGYHAGLHAGTWYADLGNCITIAVTEKRTRAELESLPGEYAAIGRVPTNYYLSADSGDRSACSLAHWAVICSKMPPSPKNLRAAATAASFVS